MSKAVVYTQEELEARCKVWQERLRLQDWDIRVVFASKAELFMDHHPNHAYGDCERHLDDLRARIRVIRPEDYSHSFGVPLDMEELLVHELLHVNFAHLCAAGLSQAEQLSLETGINMAAGALIRSWRRIEQLEAEQSQQAAAQEAA